MHKCLLKILALDSVSDRFNILKAHYLHQNILDNMEPQSELKKMEVKASPRRPDGELN